jgi:CDP-diacylglycerol--glycerol-3-phosphate 3-phosphatidyltransferase
VEPGSTEESRVSARRINVPNQITLGRLVLAVIFCVLLAQYSARDAAARGWMLEACFWIFIVAAVSDIVDGYLARRQNQVTSFGRVLDPFVDKVLVGGAFILLSGPNFVGADGRHVGGVEPWMVVLIIGRELLVTSLRGVSESQGRQYAATLPGKVKMVVQCVTVPWILNSMTRPPESVWHTGAPILIWLTVVVTTFSMFSYLFAARHILAERARA